MERIITGSRASLLKPELGTLLTGRFPAIHPLPDDEAGFAYLTTLLDSILLRDVVQRRAIRDPDGPDAMASCSTSVHFHEGDTADMIG